MYDVNSQAQFGSNNLTDGANMNVFGINVGQGLQTAEGWIRNKISTKGATENVAIQNLCCAIQTETNVIPNLNVDTPTETNTIPKLTVDKPIENTEQKF